MFQPTVLKPSIMADFAKIFSKEFLNKYASQIRISSDKMAHLHLIYMDKKYNQCIEFSFTGNDKVKVWGLARGECFGYYTEEFDINTPKKDIIEKIEYIFDFKIELDANGGIESA